MSAAVEEATSPVLEIPSFLVKQLNAPKYGLDELELAQSIQEVELETQIAGASFIKVHVEDPDWRIIRSGLLKCSEDGLLNEVRVEFPEGTGYFWRLCAVEGSTELAQANLILTFEDEVIAKLREQWGHMTAPAGTSTRAQFVRALVHQANSNEHLHPPIKFVSPGVNRKEPVQQSTETKAARQKREATENKERGIHPGAQTGMSVGGSAMTNGQRLVAGELLKVANELNAGPTATEALLYAAIGETRLGQDNSTSSAGAQGVLQSLHAPFETQAQARNFLNGSEDFQKGGAIHLSRTVSNPKQIAVEVEVPSIWPSNSYEGQSGGTGFLLEAQQILHAGGGISAGGEASHSNESDVGQLSRGTQENPDEDSWACIQRLASQVNWSAFTDGRDTLFYMDGPDLIAQRPVLYIDVPENHIVREDKGGQAISEYGALIRPLTFTMDNTNFEYHATHKVKGRVQHRSKLAKPSTPAEIRMLMLCGMTEYRAGDVFVFKNSGPISENGGRWIVSDATRECMKYPYTKFILVPPTEPAPEPKAESTTAVAASPIFGATNPAPGATWGRLDMGFDGNYGEAGPVAPYDGTVRVTGIGGWPGEGVYFYIVNDNQSGPDYTRAMYFAEGATPIVADKTHVVAGTPLGKRVFHGGTGALGNFEIGPAKTDNGDTLAKAYGLKSERSRKMVLAFAGWLQTLGAGAPTDTTAAGGP